MRDELSLAEAVEIEAHMSIWGQHDGSFVDYLRSQASTGVPPAGVGSMDAMPRRIDPNQLRTELATLRSMLAADEALVAADPKADMAKALVPVIAETHAKIAAVEEQLAEVVGA